MPLVIFDNVNNAYFWPQGLEEDNKEASSTKRYPICKESYIFSLFNGGKEKLEVYGLDETRIITRHTLVITPEGLGTCWYFKKNTQDGSFNLESQFACEQRMADLFRKLELNMIQTNQQGNQQGNQQRNQEKGSFIASK